MLTLILMKKADTKYTPHPPYISYTKWLELYKKYSPKLAEVLRLPNDEKFFDFLREVMSLLSNDKVPAAGSNCTHCQFVKNTNDFNAGVKSVKEIAL